MPMTILTSALMLMMTSIKAMLTAMTKASAATVLLVVCLIQILRRPVP
jgi:hypothetical protein